MNSVYDDVEYVVEASQNFLKQVQNSHKGKLPGTLNSGRSANFSQHNTRQSFSQDEDMLQSPFKPVMNTYQQNTPSNSNESFNTSFVQSGQKVYVQQQQSQMSNGKFRSQQQQDQSNRAFQQHQRNGNGGRVLNQQTPVQYTYPSHTSSPYTPQVDYTHMVPSRGPIYYDRQVPMMNGTVQYAPAMYAPLPEQYMYPSTTFPLGYSPAAMHMQPPPPPPPPHRHFVGGFDASSSVNATPIDPRYTHYIPSDASSVPRRISPPRLSPQEKIYNGNQERVAVEGYDRQHDLYESYQGSSVRRSATKPVTDDSVPALGLSFGLGPVEVPTNTTTSRPPGLVVHSPEDITSLIETMKISPEENTFGRRLSAVSD